MLHPASQASLSISYPVADELQTPSAHHRHSRLLTLSRPLRILCVSISELFIAIVSGILGAFAHINMDPKTPNQSRTPILFLHGVNHNQTASLFGRIALRLHSIIKRQSLGSFYSLNYAGVVTNGQTDTFETYADRVFRKVDQIYRETHRLPTLIGHSMGGLVATCLAKKWEAAIKEGHYQCENGNRLLLPCSHSITNIITLGSSFRGSPIADAMCGFHNVLGARPITVYQQMVTDSEKSKCLNKLRRFAIENSRTDKIRYFNIGSTLDQFVPKGYFVTSHGQHQYELHHLGHLGLLWSPMVWSRVHNWLVRADQGHQIL